MPSPDRTLGPYGPNPNLCPHPSAARPSAAPSLRRHREDTQPPQCRPPEHRDIATKLITLAPVNPLGPLNVLGPVNTLGLANTAG